MEEIGMLFKGDPTFPIIFRERPKWQFWRIVELRRKRKAENGSAIESMLEG